MFSLLREKNTTREPFFILVWRRLFKQQMKRFIPSLHRSSFRFLSLCLFSLFISLLIFITQHHWTSFDRLVIYFIQISSRQNRLIEQCTDEQKEKHGQLFRSFEPEWSGCYADLYLYALENHSRPVETLIDIGANKGHTIASWFAFFSPELNIDPARLGQYLKLNNQLAETCGSCNDCQDPPLGTTKKGKQKLQIHAFELQPGTIQMLQETRQWMNISEHSTSMFEIHGMAVSDRTGQTLFKKCNAGNEVCSLDISDASSDDRMQVKSITLDDFTKQYHLATIDILKIDTEGYEPLVFRGARRLLNEHRIRMFIFEHLQEGAWRNTSLAIEMTRLTNIGYICYMIGKTGLIRVSHCWNEKFCTRHSNVLCVSSRDEQLMLNIDQLRLKDTNSIRCQTTGTYNQQ